VAANARPDAGVRASGHLDRRVRSACSSWVLSPTATWLVGALYKRVGRLKLTLLAICIDIATL
jgi:low temperature requirement protein LtrA